MDLLELTDFLNHVVAETLGLFIFSFAFGGFLALPIFGIWFWGIWMLRRSCFFYWAWVPLVLFATALLLFHIHSVYAAYSKPEVTGRTGPGSAFPHLATPFFIPLMMLGCSMAISPLLLVIAFCFLSGRTPKKAT